jgi:5-methylcytosine-specific restriction endonuclease McrA
VLHRKPPKPIFYDNFSPGQCRYCGEAILDAKGKLRIRANWHAGCLEAYKTIYWPAHTRKAVWKRDHGQCAHCPTKADSIRGNWHVDHIKPLIEAKGDLDYWRMENLATLCVECHTIKTSAEATARAAARRAALASIHETSTNSESE